MGDPVAGALREVARAQAQRKLPDMRVAIRDGEKSKRRLPSSGPIHGVFNILQQRQNGYASPLV